MRFPAAGRRLRVRRYSDVKKNEALRLPVAMVQREEHDGTRQYILEKIPCT